MIFRADCDIIYIEREGKCMIELSHKKVDKFLQYLRIAAFEEFTAGTDEDWDHATNFAVTVGSKLMDMLGLDIIVERD